VKGCLLEIQQMNTENNNPYQTSVPTSPPALLREGHSKLAVASFVTAIVGGLSLFIIFFVLGYMELNTPGGVDETSEAAILIGLGIILAVFVLLISLGLGIGGLIQKERKRIFSVLGVVFSSFTLLVFSIVMMLG
jgi:hypothetical protein